MKTQKEIFNTLHLEQKERGLEITMRHVALTLTLFVFGCVAAFGFRSKAIGGGTNEIAYHYIGGTVGEVGAISAFPNTKEEVAVLASGLQQKGIRYVMVIDNLEKKQFNLMCYSSAEGNDGIRWVVAVQPAVPEQHHLPACAVGSNSMYSLLFTGSENAVIISANDINTRAREMERLVSKVSSSKGSRIVFGRTPYRPFKMQGTHMLLVASPTEKKTLVCRQYERDGTESQPASCIQGAKFCRVGLTQQKIICTKTLDTFPDGLM